MCEKNSQTAISQIAKKKIVHSAGLSDRFHMHPWIQKATQEQWWHVESNLHVNVMAPILIIAQWLRMRKILFWSCYVLLHCVMTSQCHDDIIGGVITANFTIKRRSRSRFFQKITEAIQTSEYTPVM